MQYRLTALCRHRDSVKAFSGGPLSITYTMLRYYAPLDLWYERDKKTKNPILGFRGQYRFLSNFWVQDVLVQVSKRRSIQFRSAEHAFMWHKSDDEEYQQQILDAIHPAEAKRLGNNNRLRAMGLLRENWEEDDALRLRVMYKVLKAKYNDIVLSMLLSDTGNRYLEETNSWGDTFYGRCNGSGLNNLGRLSMCVRHEQRIELGRG